MLRKLYRPQVKELTEDGTAEVVFATMSVIDKDGDVTTPGAFGSQKAKFMIAHDWGKLNVGAAEVFERNGEAVARIKFYLDTEGGREAYQVIKNNLANGVADEYSYGFDVIESSDGQQDDRSVRFLKKMKVWEVSVVVIGAGVNTRTLAVKSGEKAWAELAGTMEAAQEAIHTAAHALLFGDSDDGWVSIQGTYPDRVIVCESRYDEDRRYWQFSWALDMEGNAILSDQVEVELAVVVTRKGLRYADEFSRVYGMNVGFVERSKALTALRTEQKREPLSEANRTRIEKLKDSLSAMLESGAQAHDPQPDADDEAAEQLFAEYTLSKVGRRGG